VRWTALFTGAAALHAASQPTYTPVVRTNVMVAMRDQVRLATDLYLPADDGKFPVIVYRTPYNKDGLRGHGNYFASRGYVVVAQDVRGRFKSEGSFYAFVNEGMDGYDAIEWAAVQPWSDGKVMTNGASYLAWDQYHAAMYRPPHLVAMFADVGGNNFLEDFAHPGGAPNLGWFVWIMRSAATSPIAAKEPEARALLESALRDPAPWLAKPWEARMPLFEKFPSHQRMYEDFYTHRTLDAYWQQKGFYTQGSWREIKDVPVFFISGWYDYFAEGLIQNFTGLSRMHKTQKKMWLGPWPHSVGRSECGTADFGPTAGYDVRELALDWFDHWAKSDPFEVLTDSKVRYFRMGGGPGQLDSNGRIQHGGEWLQSAVWPPPARVTPYYMRVGRELTRAKTPMPAVDQLHHDPADPVPSIGGRYTMVPTIPGCAQDQSPIGTGASVLRFESARITVPLDVTGKVSARLWVSSALPGADFAVKLVDLYPGGYRLILSDGIVRVDKMTQTPRQIRVDVGSVSNLFAVGHRIGIEVASSNYPRAEPNPHKGLSYVHTGPVYSSAVDLPVVH